MLSMAAPPPPQANAMPTIMSRLGGTYQVNLISPRDFSLVAQLHLINNRLNQSCAIWAKLDSHVDDFGLLARLMPSSEHPDAPRRSGGDTFQREGMLALGIALAYKHKLISRDHYDLFRQRYSLVLDLLRDPLNPGNFRRHPNQFYWYRDFNRMSRDQLTPNVLAMGRLAMHNDLWDVFKSHLKRGLLLTTNTWANFRYKDELEHARKSNVPYQAKPKLADITGVEFLGYYIRGSVIASIVLYPLLWLSDLELLVNSVVKVFRSRDPKYNDDVNFVCSLVSSLDRAPTLFGIVANWIYKLRRAPTFAKGTSIYKDARLISLAAYLYGKTSETDAPLDVIWAPLIRKICG